MDEKETKTAVEAQELAAGPTDHWPKIDWLTIALIGLMVQAFWAVRLEQPTYMDAYYYTTNGQRLASGHGFTEMVIWQFLDDPAALPTPSHTYWMPLPSLLAGAGYLLRNGFGGAQLFFWLLGGLLPLLAYAISRQLVRQRWQAWAAALFTAAGSYYAAFLSQPTTFTPFAWAGGFCLLALGMAARNDRSLNTPDFDENATSSRRWLWWLLAGLAAGLAHLARADGILLLLVGLVIWTLEFLKERLASRTQEKGPNRRFLIPTLLLFLGGYLLVMGGWFVRNWWTIGRPLPVAATQSLFLTTYDDLFAYGRTINVEDYLAWGWANIIQSKLQGMWVALQTLIAIPGLIFLVPFIIIALVGLYRRPASRTMLRPVILFTLAIFISSSLLFTFPGIRGTLFHSSVALWPWSAALAPVGIGLAVDWAAQRLPHWQPERAKRIFTALFIVIAFILSLAVSQFRVNPMEDPDIFRQVGTRLSPSSVVMVGNAPAMHYYTGITAVSVPNDSIAVVLEAADRYGVTHIMLNENRPQPLEGLYNDRDQNPRLQLLETVDGTRLYELVSP